jgi:hypothetical protein
MFDCCACEGPGNVLLALFNEPLYSLRCATIKELPPTFVNKFKRKKT